MKRNITLAGLLVAALFFAGCSSRIEFVGYGSAMPLQHGLETRLISDGQGGALLRVTNRTDGILSVNQSPLAVAIGVRCQGQAVAPSYRIMAHMNVHPHADSFVVLTPGQTREIAVPLSCCRGEIRTLDGGYRLGKGKLYDVDVRLHPYFGTFTAATCESVLAEFKIPNYLHETLRANAMTVRAVRALRLQGNSKKLL